MLKPAFFRFFYWKCMFSLILRFILLRRRQLFQSSWYVNQCNHRYKHKTNTTSLHVSKLNVYCQASLFITVAERFLQQPCTPPHYLYGERLKTKGRGVKGNGKTLRRATVGGLIRKWQIEVLAGWWYIYIYICMYI